MSGLSRETEALLERVRGGESLTPAHRARLKAMILAEAAGASVVATATSAAAWTAAGVKIIGAVGLLVVAGAGVAVATGGADGPPTTMVSRPPAKGGSSTLAARSAHVDPRASTSEVPVLPITEAAKVPVGAERAAPEAPGAPSAAALSALAPTVARSFAPVPSIAQPPARVEAPAPVVVPTGVAASTAQPSDPAPVARASTLEEETELLREADRAVKAGDPDRALILLDAFAERFSSSVLEPERAAERIFALCQANRAEEARRSAVAFLRAHPGGPLAARVEASCAASKAP